MKMEINFKTMATIIYRDYFLKKLFARKYISFAKPFYLLIHIKNYLLNKNFITREGITHIRQTNLIYL